MKPSTKVFFYILSFPVLLVSFFGFASSTTGSSAQAPAKTLTVYKDPNCGCCQQWIKHMRSNGFSVRVENRTRAAMQKIKDNLGIPPKARSCHTALLGQWVIEGHVPAGSLLRAMKKLENPALLTVPGMPIGTPGMGPFNRPFEVKYIDKNNQLQRIEIVNTASMLNK
jgi:hypothetical protein